MTEVTFRFPHLLIIVDVVHQEAALVPLTPHSSAQPVRLSLGELQGMLEEIKRSRS